MILLIPGPVSTRPEVRAAMAVDYAPWDDSFRDLSRKIRKRVRAIAGGQPKTHSALPLQGCGHFAIEASIRSLLPAGGRMLIPLTGQYADRMVRLAREAGRQVVELAVDRNRRIPSAQIAEALAADAAISHLGLVWSETSTGVVQDAHAIGAVVRAAGRRMILDAVSAFGAQPLDVSAQTEIDSVVFTSNKCLEGLPGMAFAVVRHDHLLPLGQAGSYALDLADIYNIAQRDDGGTLRFTPPAQTLAALDVALDFYAAEGGQPARLARYQENARIVYQGLRDLGLRPCLAEAEQGPVVINIHAAPDPNWSLPGFVDGLKRRGFTISNFHNTVEPSFRVGCIGHVTPDDMRRFVSAVDAVLLELGVQRRS